MCHIQRRPGITPAKIAETLGLTRGAVSKIIDKLEAKGWLARSTKPEDGRVQLLSLSSRGNRALPELAAIADHNDQVFFEGLNSEEKDRLRRLLCKLVDFHQIRDVPVE